MMSSGFILGACVCLVVFWCGLATGYWMHRAAHKDGVKLMDRVTSDQVPYDDLYKDEELVQKTTGGDFEPMLERDESWR